MSQEYRSYVHSWLRSTGFSMSKQQIDCAVRLLQHFDDGYTEMSYAHVLMAFYTGLKFERERAASNAGRHSLT